MGRILLIRHGQSEWNAVKRWQGWADPPLTELGRRQAEVAAEAVGEVDAVVSSDLVRARHTAEIMAEAIGVGPVVVEAGLRERDAGPWTGLTREEIDAGWPGALEAWEPPEGFEEEADLMARVVPAVHRAAAAGSVVLAIAHGGVIGALERYLGHTHVRTPNLGGRVFHLDAGELTAGEALLLADPDRVTVTAPPEV